MRCLVWTLVAAAPVLVTACGQPASEQAHEAEATLTYVCPDGWRFDVLVETDGVRLFLPDRTVDLEHIPSASGAKYEAGEVLYWSKGEEALVEVDGSAHSGCSVTNHGSPWARAAADGVTFRALGQEPGWIVNLRADGSAEVSADYGETEVAFPSSELDRGEDGRLTVSADHDGHAVEMRIDPGECFDAMSGFELPAEVHLTLDGRRLDGCGRPLASDFFDDGSAGAR